MNGYLAHMYYVGTALVPRAGHRYISVWIPGAKSHKAACLTARLALSASGWVPISSARIVNGKLGPERRFI